MTVAISANNNVGMASPRLIVFMLFIMILMPDFMLFIIDMSGVSKLSSFILKPFRYTGNEDT